MYPDALSDVEVPVKLMEWPVLLQCSATTDFSGWCSHMSVWCSVHLASIVFLLCLTYNSLHLHRIWYAPRTVSSNSSLATAASVQFSFLGCEPFWYYVSLEIWLFYCGWCDETVSWLYLWVFHFPSSPLFFVAGLVRCHCDYICFVWRLV